jgi:1-acyl-sn-glycerol-3-phosphate acyltransferase
LDDYDSQDDGEGTVNTNSYKRSDLKSALAKHEEKFKHQIDYTDWNIIYKDNSQQRLKIKESLAIIALKPDLNATTRSTPLIIFPEGVKNKKKVKFKFKENTSSIDSSRI